MVNNHSLIQIIEMRAVEELKIKIKWMRHEQSKQREKYGLMLMNNIATKLKGGEDLPMWALCAPKKCCRKTKELLLMKHELEVWRCDRHYRNT